MPNHIDPKRPSAVRRALLCALAALLGACCHNSEPASAQTRQRGTPTENRTRQPAEAAHPDHWQVPPLPEDNLLQNPWFQRTLDPWVGDGHWQGDTAKWGNPTPGDSAGSSARISTGRRADSDVGKTVDIGQDAYLYQVVAADPKFTTLKFDMYWVAHTINPAEVNVYGGPSETGPWTHAWRPFHQIHTKPLRPPQGRSANSLWRHYSDLTEQVSTTISEGYPFYKIEFHARLPDQSGGFKFTGVYFSAVGGAASDTAPRDRRRRTAPAD